MPSEDDTPLLGPHCNPAALTSDLIMVVITTAMMHTGLHLAAIPTMRLLATWAQMACCFAQYCLTPRA